MERGFIEMNGISLNLKRRVPSPKSGDDKNWTLYLRYNDPVETDYSTVAYVNFKTAQDIVDAGKAVWVDDPWEKVKVENKDKKIKELEEAIGKYRKELNKVHYALGSMVQSQHTTEAKAIICNVGFLNRFKG